MAVNGLSDIAAIVTVPKSEYERLLRDSERLESVIRCMQKCESLNAVKAILNIDEENKEVIE